MDTFGQGAYLACTGSWPATDCTKSKSHLPEHCESWIGMCAAAFAEAAGGRDGEPDVQAARWPG